MFYSSVKLAEAWSEDWWLLWGGKPACTDTHRICFPTEWCQFELYGAFLNKYLSVIEVADLIMTGKSTLLLIVMMWDYLLINCTGKDLEWKWNLSISTSALILSGQQLSEVGGTWLYRWHSKSKTSKWHQYHSLSRRASWRWNMLLCVFVRTSIACGNDGTGRKKKTRERPHPPHFNVSHFKGVYNSETGGFIASLSLFYPDTLSLCLCRKKLNMKE